MIGAILDSNGIVLDTKVLNSLSEYPGAVTCPAWVGIGMHIDTPMPEGYQENPQPAKEELMAELQTLAAKIQAME
jgi:hypothetical protein